LIRGLANHKSKKITPKFAIAKAMVYLALSSVPKPVIYTEDVLGAIRRDFGELTWIPTYRMTLEALHELKEQGLVDKIGSVDYGYFWWSKERLV